MLLYNTDLYSTISSNVHGKLPHEMDDTAYMFSCPFSPSISKLKILFFSSL